MATAPSITMMISYIDGTQESKDARFARLLPVLICPRCSGGLAHRAKNLVCLTCDVTYPVRSWTPILLPIGVDDVGAATVNTEDPVSRHPYSASAMEIIAAHSNGLVLDLGAGGKFDRYFNVIQVDIFRYPAVDIVASADKLPFADNTFDAVVSQAVFEHLQFPEWAVAEIRRVLKAGGIAKIDTAFLQPEHGYPHHFYNATESGLRHWFRDFEIIWSGVEPFQQPKWALHWFLGVYLDYIGSEFANVLRCLSVGELNDVLQRHADGVTVESDGPFIVALDAIPVRFQRVLAAGVSVKAVNRSKELATTFPDVRPLPPSVDREREMELLRSELASIQTTHQSLQSRFDALRDQADFLFQFAPGLRQKAPNFVDILGEGGLRLDAIQDDAMRRGRSSEPFASIFMAPSNGARLLDTFFSLTNQVYGGWEFLVVLRGGVKPTLFGLASRLERLDNRVRVIHAETNEDVLSLCAGEYRLYLSDGSTLVPTALEEVITAARFTDGVAGISFDYERSSNFGEYAIRCHAQMPLKQFDAVACFVRAGVTFSESNEFGTYSHIAKPLMRLAGEAEVTLAPLKAKFNFLLERNLELTTSNRSATLELENATIEWRQLTDDTANYLSQFAPETRGAGDIQIAAAARNGIARLLRNNLPVKWWQALQNLNYRRHGGGSGSRAAPANDPFATFILEPSSTTGLIHTFFSLTHQTYSSWRLVLIENHEQSPAIRRAIHDFGRLDKRIAVVNGGNQHTKASLIDSFTRGSYNLRLVDGVSLRFHCVEEVVSLVTDNPRVTEITCDFDWAQCMPTPAMRCYNEDVRSSELDDTNAFSGLFAFKSDTPPEIESCESFNRRAHIPKSLFAVSKWSQ